MTNTLNDLIEELTAMRDDLEIDLGPGAADLIKVCMATQPSWPLAHAVGALTIDVETSTLWIAEGGSDSDSPYVTSRAWDGGMILPD